MLCPLDKPELWEKFLDAVRLFFKKKGYIEVTTPVMALPGSFESCIDVFRVIGVNGKVKGELVSSPEFALKGLLARLNRPVFQISKAFRDDPESSIHLAEFHMLEFYDPSIDYESLMQLVEAFLTELFEGVVVSFLSLPDVISRTLGIFLEDVSDFSKLLDLAKSHTETTGCQSWDDVFFRLMETCIEPTLDPNIFTILHTFPTSVSPLSQVTSYHSFWAERFEIYRGNMELGNGCMELWDTRVLKQRYNDAAIQRIARGKVPHSWPAEIEEAIQKAPAVSSAGGVALGMERMFTLFDGPQHS